MNISLTVTPEEVEQIAVALTSDPGTDRTPEDTRNALLSQLVIRAVVFHHVQTPAASSYCRQARAALNHRERITRLPRAKRSGSPGLKTPGY
jgi:hypothetical protein